MGYRIDDFEKNQNWQATARRENGLEVAVMKGEASSAFEGNFYLYEDGWLPPHPAAGGMHTYSANEITLMFDSGELSLVRGVIPR